ncbi:MAG: glycosyltransferase family 9 protein [Lentimicrobiaceae bacterium]|nr:glycosyltransferase family 9 protein [Lentimicrobiaceae bacterium]
MGSIIQATPLLATLRNRYPHAEIIFVSTTANKAILSKIPSINTLVLLNDKSFFTLIASIFPFMLKLIRKRIKVYYDLEIYSHFSSLVTTCSLAKNRIGFYLRSSDYRMGIYTHMMYYNINSSISLVYLQLARLLGISDITTELYDFRPFAITSMEYSKEEKLHLQDDNYFVINVNASDLRLERRWGNNNFASLISMLQEQFPDYKIVLIGNKSEQQYVQELMSHLNALHNIINYAGKTTIDELIALIGNANLMITNDTGPMHIAFASKTKTVALFGPCTPSQYGNFEQTNIIYHRVYCSPCVHEFAKPPCNGDNQCMKNITPDEVLIAVKDAVSNNFSPNPPFLKDDIIWKKMENTNVPLGIVSRKKKI